MTTWNANIDINKPNVEMTKAQLVQSISIKFSSSLSVSLCWRISIVGHDL